MTPVSHPACTRPLIPRCPAVAHAEDVFRLINSGDAAIARGDTAAAVAAYSQAIDLDASQGLALTKRAAALAAQHKHGAALRDLDAALALDPASASVLTKRGQLHLDLCSFAAAERDFAAVLSARPDHKASVASMAALQQARTSLERAEVRAGGQAGKGARRCNASSLSRLAHFPHQRPAGAAGGGEHPRS